MEANTNNQILAIYIKLGTYDNNYIPGEHAYHNLIPDTRATSFSTGIMGEHEFQVYYPRVTRKQIKKAIQTGFNILDSIDTMDYAYGDLIKQVLAFIGLADHLNLTSYQEAEAYLAKLDQINENYYYQDPESNDLDLEIALDTVQITPQLNSRSYVIEFNW